MTATCWSAPSTSIRHGSAAFRGSSLRMPHSTRPTTRQRRKPKASSASAFPIAPPKAPRANANRRSAGSATARNGAPDARGASAWPNADTASTAAATRVRPECSAGSASASSPTISSTSVAPWKSRPLHRSSRSQPTTQSDIPPAIPGGMSLWPRPIDHAQKHQFCAGK